MTQDKAGTRTAPDDQEPTLAEIRASVEALLHPGYDVALFDDTPQECLRAMLAFHRLLSRWADLHGHGAGPFPLVDGSHFGESFGGMIAVVHDGAPGDFSPSGDAFDELPEGAKVRERIERRFDVVFETWNGWATFVAPG